MPETSREHHPQLDRDRPDRTAGSEPFEPQTRIGGTALAEWGSAASLRHGTRWRQEDDGVGSVRDGGDVRRLQDWGNAGDGGEHDSRGHGWGAFDGEGEFGNFRQGLEGPKRKKIEERGGREEGIRGVRGN